MQRPRRVGHAQSVTRHTNSATARYLKVVAFLEPTWNSPAPGWPLTVSVCKKLRTYIDGVPKSVMSELISPHRPDLSARIAICTRKKLSSDARFSVCDGDPVSDFWRLLTHQYPSFWAWD